MEYVLKEKNKRYISVLLFLIIISMAIIFSFRCPINPFQGMESGRDSSVFQYVASLMQRGLMPYVDTFDHKGPLIYIINYFGLSLGGTIGIWVLEILTLCVIFFGIYKIARLKVNRISALIILLLCSALLYEYFDGGNYTEEYAVAFITVSLFYFLDYFLNERITNARLIIIGACFGAVCMLRVNMIATWIVFCIAVLVECILKKKIYHIWRYLVFFLIGACLVILPQIIWLLVNGAFTGFVEDYIVFNLSYSSAGETIWSDRKETILYFASNIIVIISFIATFVLCFRKTTRALNITYLIYWIFTFATVVMTGRSYAHYGMTLVPLIAFPMASAVDELRSINGKNDDITRGLKRPIPYACVILLIVLFALSIPNWFKYSRDAAGLFINRGTYSVSAYIQDVCDVIEENSDEDDLISYYGSLDSVYLITGRMSASKYSYQFPIIEFSEEVEEGYFSDLENTMPELIIVETFRDTDRLDEFLQENNYTIIWPDNDEGRVLVYKR